MVSKSIKELQWSSTASEPRRRAACFKEEQNDRSVRRDFGEHTTKTRPGCSDPKISSKSLSSGDISMTRTSILLRHWLG
jgi:hypothetical protein